MPQFDDYQQSTLAMNLLTYGTAKARKTTWAGQAAIAGYTTVILDCDDGSVVLKQLPPDARKRLHIIPIADSADRFSAIEFIGCMFKRRDFIWAERQRMQIISASGVQDNDTYVRVRPALLTNSTFLVLDSWTALVNSLRGKIFKDMGISFDEAKKLEWSDYGSGNQILNNILMCWRGLPAHKCIIGHEQYYERTLKINGAETKRTRTQLISFSGNSASSIPAFFDDVLYFYVKDAMGKPQFMISTSASENRDGGGRIVEPGDYKFDDMQFPKFVEKAGVFVPSPSHQRDEFIAYMNPAEARAFFDKSKAPVSAASLIAPAASTTVALKLGS